MRLLHLKLILFFFSSCFYGYSQEYAKIIDQRTEYTVEDENTAYIKETYTIQINSEKGYYYSIYRDYINSFRKLKSVEIIVYKDNMKVKKLNKSDGREFGFNPSYEINDSKVFVLDPEYKNYPYTLQVTSEVKLDGFMSLPTWMPRMYFNLSVDKASLTINYPSNIELKFKEYNLSGTEVRNADNSISTQYEILNLPSLNNTMRYEDFYNAEAKVLISPRHFNLENHAGSFESWSDFGDWFHDLNEDNYALTESTKQYIDQIITNDSSEIQVVGQIYKYMQDRTRYVSIQLGIGGFKSLPTSEVEEFGFGDCKALSTYMKNMLDYAGIKSNYILVRAGKDVPDMIVDFPSSQFNHVFLGIPQLGDTLYLECTSQTVPPNYIGSFTDDRYVLWVDKNRSRIIRTPQYNENRNVQLNRGEINIDENGVGTYKLKSYNHGIFYDEIQLYYQAPDDYIKNYNQKKFDFTDYVISDFKFNQPLRDSAKFVSTYEMSITGLGKVTGDNLLLPTTYSQPVKNYIDFDKSKKYASIKRGLTIIDEIKIEIPKNYWIQLKNEPVFINSKFGSYQLTLKPVGDGMIKVVRKVIFYKGNYIKEEFSEFLDFYNKIQKSENGRFYAKSKT